MSIKVGVFGAGGRMGSTVCRAVESDPQLRLVAALDPHHEGLDLRAVAGTEIDLPIAAHPESLLQADVQVAIDFTEADAARKNLDFMAANGIHAVVGTTGLTDVDLAHLERAFTRSNCLIAPNFAIGALLMMKFAAAAAPYFETVDITEFHHDQKVDAPSGTAMLTAERIFEAKSEWPLDRTEVEVVAGSRGGVGPGGVHIHSVRMRGMVAHQEVLFGTTGQTLTIRHDSYDRTSFMPGVIMATKAIGDHPGVTVGLDVLLGM
jgi:4-hydroxy-tetrahydrodipicolinate reductase